MATRNQVSFRRVNGRIIPLRINPQAEGAALGAAGVGAALGAAKLAAKYTREAVFYEKAGRSFLKTVGATANATGKTFLGKSHEMHRAATNVKQFGTMAGGALIGAGISRALPDKWKKKVNDSALAQGAGAVAGAAAASFVLRSSYYHHLGTKLWPAVKLAGSKATRFFFKTVK